MDLQELKKLHDKAYNSNQVTRERAADDLVFLWVTNWDDNLLDDAQLSFRGEFDVIRKGVRQALSDLNENPVTIDFRPKAESRDDGAEFLDGIFRTDERINSTIESYETAAQDAVVCGYGAWELYTEYESMRNGNKNQVIRRRPVVEANNNCFWDPNAKNKDKSDAMYVSILTAYSSDGYEDLVFEMTGEEIDASNESFAYPEESYTFPWAAEEQELIYVVSFYHKELVKDKVITMIDPIMGQPIQLRESDLKKDDIKDDLKEAGYETVDEKDIERWEVKKYLASGARILNGDGEGEVIAGDNIPVVPCYGERAWIEGNEHYEGLVRKAKDPQRLRNFLLSYVADIASKSGRTKPIYTAEQIQGFEFMYEKNGADNDFPYMLQHLKGADGKDLPLGPVGSSPEQPIPSAVGALIQETRQAVDDVAGSGLPQDISDPDVSGRALQLLQTRLDKQSVVYQKNLKHAKRRDGEIYAGMAVEVYDAPRKVTMTMPDGSQKTVEVMESIMDNDSGEMVVLNDLSNQEFDVFAEIGPSYSSKKEEIQVQLNEMVASLPPEDPMIAVINLTRAQMLEGSHTEMIRDHANKRMILEGFKEPETEEEMAMMEQQAQQAQQPDPNMVLAQAEQGKAEAEMKKAGVAEFREQRMLQADQFKAQTDQGKLQIDAFKAQTDRMNMQVDAQEAGANIQLTNTKATGQQLDNIIKTKNPYRATAR